MPYTKQMPEITIPDNQYKRFTKPSEGEIFGNLWATKNIDFDLSKGCIRLAERMMTIYSAADDADFGLPKAYIRTNADTTERYWMLAGTRLWKTNTTSPTTTWAEAAAGTYTGLTTDYDYDMAIFGKVGSYDRLVISRPTDLAMLTGGTTLDNSWWDTTLAQAAMSSTNPHILHQFMNLLLVADGNFLNTIDDSLVVTAPKLTLPQEMQIVWMANDGYYVHIGTRNIRNGEAFVFFWDGTSTTYNDYAPVNATGSYAGKAINGVMYTVNTNGQLLQFNGKSFERIAAFPIENKRIPWDSFTGNPPHLIHHNGISVIKGKLAILVQAMVSGWSGFCIDEFPSGIWVYDPNIGLYCQDTLGQSTNELDVSKGGSDLSAVGAISPVIFSDMVLIGATVYTSGTATRNCLIIKTSPLTTESMLQYGYFVTVQIPSAEVRGFWKRLKTIFKKMDTTSHKIIIKYRTRKETNWGDYFYYTKFAATWASTTTLTLTTAANPDVDLAAIAAGDEMEVINGRGEGICVHVSSVSTVAGTYTVTIDETVSSDYTGTCKVRFRKWIKLGTITNNINITSKIMSIIKRTPWIQFKVELRGTSFSPEIEKLILSYGEMAK